MARWQSKTSRPKPTYDKRHLWVREWGPRIDDWQRMYPWRRPYVDKDFADNWFNETHHLNLNKLDLVDLRAATKDQLFFFNRHSYEQTDRIAMGSCLGPLLANFFMCSIEDTLKHEGKMPTYYKRYVRYVDDTLTIMPVITWRWRVKVCCLFWVPSCSTNTHMLRLRCTLNPQILAFCCITRAM